MQGGMVERARHWLSVVLGLFLAVAALASPAFTQDDPTAPVPTPSQTVPAAVSPAGGVMDVKYAAGKLSVRAQKADLPLLLKRISEVTAIPVEVSAGVSGAISISFSDLSLETGINRILESAGEKNLATEYAKKPGATKDEYKIEKIIIMRRGEVPEKPGVSGKESTPSKDEELEALKRRVAERDRAYREFFEEMDRKKSKIARAIEEYFDPKTSEGRRDRIRTFIRQASTSKPEDKETLKAAVFEPRFERLLGDIQLALLHAIQERPEEKDKDFLVDMLDRNIMPGWLVYAMPKIWDERYVPWLLRMSSEPPRSAETIEMLGQMNVKQAVPVLEEALKDPKDSVRLNAAIALRNITGKLYDFKR